MAHKRLSTAVSIIGAFLLNTQLFAADCGVAQEHFKKGVAAGKQANWTEAQKWLAKSVSECNKFDNWYLLGQTEMKMMNYPAAASAFEDARRFGKDDDQRAIAIARYAEVQAKEGKISEPLTLLHEARKMHSKSPEWITKLAIGLDRKRTKQPITVAQITGALNNRSIKLFKLNTAPNINVNINFEFNSTNVVNASKDSIDVLAEALIDESFNGKNITLVGHSDARGDEPYNLALSEKRADAIYQAIIAKQPKLKGRLKIAGFGEANPLYEGETEDVYLLNRRIEVKLDD
jgi:outer membrane protein OmpA-like peptidoglycan-associated protein